MAGTFSRRLHAFCSKQAIPIIEAGSGERKHELAEPHVPKDATFRGLFLVITGNAPAPIWEVDRAGSSLRNSQHSDNMLSLVLRLATRLLSPVPARVGETWSR